MWRYILFSTLFFQVYGVGLKNTKFGVIDILNELENSRYGSILLKKSKIKANKLGKPLNKIIHFGESSKMDTQYLRRLSSSGANIEYEKKFNISINKSNDLSHAVLDLAHELTHFLYKKEQNPYKKGFSMNKYIKNAIGGSGGEVDAYIVECRVADELNLLDRTTPALCKEIIQSKRISREDLIKRYYGLGSYYNLFINELGPLVSHRDFEYLSDKKGDFISSTWQLPYPIAMLRQFKELKRNVCINNQRLRKRNLASLLTDLPSC